MCQLPDEPVLVPDRLHAMDGNNSMKWVDGSGHANQHVFTSYYLIPLSKVNKFKDDVHTHPGANKKSSHPLPPGHENEWCADNLNAANSISEGMVTVFQQMGSFLCLSTFNHWDSSGNEAKWEAVSKLFNYFVQWCAMGGLINGHNTHKTHIQKKQNPRATFCNDRQPIANLVWRVSTPSHWEREQNGE